MTNDDIQQIINKLEDHEKRIRAIEGLDSRLVPDNKSRTEKTKTLREIIRGRKLNNGSEKLTVIVGYYEKIVGSLIKKDDFRKAWQESKMIGVYKTNLLDDASGEYIRILPGGECDLTQTGEEFFDKFLKNESPKSTSK